MTRPFEGMAAKPFASRVGRGLAEQLRHVPLRVKLVLLICALVTAALVAAGFAATTLLRHSLMNHLDQQLATASLRLSDQVGGHRGAPTAGGRIRVPSPAPANTSDGGATTPASGPPSCDPGRTDVGYPHLPSEYFFQQSNAAGVPTTCSMNPLNSSDRAPAIPGLPIAAVLAHKNRAFTVRSRNGGGHWRVVVSALEDGAGSIAVATPLSDVTDTLSQLVLLDLAIGAPVVIALAGMSYFAVRRSLKPLVDVEHTAVRIAAGDLTQRVPGSDSRTEVGKLALALNGMLGQLEEAFGSRATSERAARDSELRMRRFITDASHELRTPLTSIRGFAELYRMGAVKSGPDIDRAMGRIENESIRMASLVDDLLLLARLDRIRPLELELIDLRTIAADAVHDAQAIAIRRVVRLEPTGEEPVLVRGDDARLRQIVGNLVTNALTHTPDSASVTVHVTVDQTGVTSFGVLEVADSGPGLSAEDANRVFERFYRVDESRARPNGGSGLGLSIVAALAVAHGGTADVTSEAGKGSRFRVRIPLA